MHTTRTPDMKATARLRASVPAQSWQLATPRTLLRPVDLTSRRPSRREFLVYSPDVSNSRFLRSLGFEIPAGIRELVGEADGAGLSPERVDLLDMDVLVWLDAAEGEGPLDEPLYERLPVHTEGREIFLESDDRLGGASFISVLSLPFLFDRMTPMLEAAIDGDPKSTS